MSTHSKNKNLVKKKAKESKKHKYLYCLYHLYKPLLPISICIIYTMLFCGHYRQTLSSIRLLLGLKALCILEKHSTTELHSQSSLYLTASYQGGHKASNLRPQGAPGHQTHLWGMRAESLCICWSSQWPLILIMNHKQLTGKGQSSAVESLPGRQCPAPPLQS